MAAKSMEEIAEKLTKIKFRHQLFGGVREDDVWRTLQSMQQEYSAVVDAQRQWYEALLAQRSPGVSAPKEAAPTWRS